MRDQEIDPSERLVMHRAPAGLLEGALLEARRAPSAPGWTQWVGLAAAFAVGVWAGGLLSAGAEPDPAPVAFVSSLDGRSADALRPVRLVLHAPGAKTVSVAGDWNDWEAGRDALHAVGDGLFSTVMLLPPGRYEYMFVVDGEGWRSDPTAPLARDDGFGNRNSVLEI